MLQSHLIRKSQHFIKFSAESAFHWTTCCHNNEDNCYDEVLLQNLQTYDEALYNEAKFILENRNIGSGLMNIYYPGVWTNYLLSCICGLELVVTSTSNPIIYLVIKHKLLL